VFASRCSTRRTFTIRDKPKQVINFYSFIFCCEIDLSGSSRAIEIIRTLVLRRSAKQSSRTQERMERVGRGGFAVDGRDLWMHEGIVGCGIEIHQAQFLK
jgi:hypothetical protein